MKIYDRIKQEQNEWKVEERSAKSMGKGSHKVFKADVKELNNSFPTLGESGSELSHFITEPRDFAEVTRLPANVKKPWLKATLKEIKYFINYNTFKIEELEKKYALTTCMDVYKSRIQSYVSLDKLKLRSVFREDLKNKEIIVDT